MKKLIYFLAILLSTHYLLAQNEYDQLTGCRLQVAGSKTTELLSEKLRTKNCNNQDLNLDCYPMMNPAAEGAEEAIKKLIIEETRTPGSIESNHLGVEAREENIVTVSLPHTTTSVAASSSQHQPISSNTASSLGACETEQEIFLSSQEQLEQVVRNKNEMEERLVKENEKLNVLKKKCEALCGVARKRRFDSEGKVIDENEQCYNQHRIVVRLQMALLNLNNIIKEAKEKSVPIAVEKEGVFVGHI